jgi:hypothetical protein
VASSKDEHSGGIDMTDDSTRHSRAATGDNPAAERAGIYEKPPPEEIEEIEAERERRLAPENRPDNSEIDNMDQIFDESGGLKD